MYRSQAKSGQSKPNGSSPNCSIVQDTILMGPLLQIFQLKLCQQFYIILQLCNSLFPPRSVICTQCNMILSINSALVLSISQFFRILVMACISSWVKGVRLNPLSSGFPRMIIKSKGLTITRVSQ